MKYSSGTLLFGSATVTFSILVMGIVLTTPALADNHKARPDNKHIGNNGHHNGNGWGATIDR